MLRSTVEEVLIKTRKELKTKVEGKNNRGGRQEVELFIHPIGLSKTNHNLHIGYD